jgi:hypothetical protein
VREQRVQDEFRIVIARLQRRDDTNIDLTFDKVAVANRFAEASVLPIVSARSANAWLSVSMQHSVTPGNSSIDGHENSSLPDP